MSGRTQLGSLRRRICSIGSEFHSLYLYCKCNSIYRLCFTSIPFDSLRIQSNFRFIHQILSEFQTLFHSFTSPVNSQSKLLEINNIFCENLFYDNIFANAIRNHYIYEQQINNWIAFSRLEDPVLIGFGSDLCAITVRSLSLNQTLHSSIISTDISQNSPKSIQLLSADIFKY